MGSISREYVQEMKRRNQVRTSTRGPYSLCSGRKKGFVVTETVVPFLRGHRMAGRRFGGGLGADRIAAPEVSMDLVIILDGKYQ
jgi:hypothetical protein